MEIITKPIESVARFTNLRQLYECRGQEKFLDLPITDWELLREVLKAGATQVWIDGALGFQLPLVRKNIPSNVLIRVQPHRSFSAFFPSVSSFFIRPEDLSLYEPYIDILDFSHVPMAQSKVLAKYYAEGAFPYKIQTLCPLCNIDVPNPLIRPKFAQSRLNCRQTCKSNSNCHKCASELKLVALSTELLKGKSEQTKEEKENDK